MKRVLLYLLGVLMFTSCEKENLNIIDRNNFSITEQTFKVQKKDIEQAINTFKAALIADPEHMLSAHAIKNFETMQEG